MYQTRNEKIMTGFKVIEAAEVIDCVVRHSLIDQEA